MGSRALSIVYQPVFLGNHASGADGVVVLFRLWTGICRRENWRMQHHKAVIYWSLDHLLPSLVSKVMKEVHGEYTEQLECQPRLRKIRPWLVVMALTGCNPNWNFLSLELH